jgi:DNA polymerase-3 subunit chi
VYLTTGDEVPNGAGVRFVVDGARPSYAGMERIVFLFDVTTRRQVAAARTQWKAAKAAAAADLLAANRWWTLGKKA